MTSLKTYVGRLLQIETETKDDTPQEKGIFSSLLGIFETKRDRESSNYLRDFSYMTARERVKSFGAFDRTEEIELIEPISILIFHARRSEDEKVKQAVKGIDKTEEVEEFVSQTLELLKLTKLKKDNKEKYDIMQSAIEAFKLLAAIYDEQKMREVLMYPKMVYERDKSNEFLNKEDSRKIMLEHFVSKMQEHVKANDKSYKETFDNTFLFTHNKNPSKRDFLKILEDKKIRYWKEKHVRRDMIGYHYKIDYGVHLPDEFLFEVKFNKEDGYVLEQTVVADSRSSSMKVDKFFEHLKWHSQPSKGEWRDVSEDVFAREGECVLDNGRCRAWYSKERLEDFGLTYSSIIFTFMGRR